MSGENAAKPLTAAGRTIALGMPQPRLPVQRCQLASPCSVPARSLAVALDSAYPMTNQRLPVPAEIRRRVLVEAGHRCAIPTCRYIEADVHHIIPWEQCQSHEYENLIALCPNCHRRADNGEIDRKSLRLYKANLRFAHDKFSNFEIDLLFELYRLPDGSRAQFPSYLMLLVKRLLEAGYVNRIETPPGVLIGGMKSNPDYLTITGKGRTFVTDLGLHEIG